MHTYIEEKQNNTAIIVTTCVATLLSVVGVAIAMNRRNRRNVVTLTARDVNDVLHDINCKLEQIQSAQAMVSDKAAIVHTSV